MNVRGFSAAAIAAGVRKQGRLDLGLIHSAVPAVTAGVFTTNLVKAAPLIIDMERLKQGMSRAILVNSGCANACTGEAGRLAALQTGAMAAQALNIPESMVQLASTGVIGEQLNVAAFAQAMPELAKALAPEGFPSVAQAMMTTDTRPKMVEKSVEIGGVAVNFLGLAKGAGMIMPNMATMLGFVVTDARIGFPELHRALIGGVERSFNRITVDGDTSTNDMVLVMANGLAENPWIDDKAAAHFALFQTTLQAVLRDLALMIVADGEGATKFITIRVSGAKEAEDAHRIARAVANSNLVKTAFFGEDANWGRIIAAIGRSGVRFNPEKVDIAFNDVTLVRDGQAVGGDAEERAGRVLREKEITVGITLQDGKADEEVYTCDLSLDYVKINADYRS
ncbi:MAG: bifunctional glutamate N-acetyltransferase/amino-acid acetyltransferase ArgJ [Desulfobulbaceae bacterium]|jgi:glutamate N-acetyltransferase/amino-acid N-acetyltransferase|nr:bifunctional glutamate N-acetyltransferase/amino-acid acetyltransferase ArgJ [Desulfobulbaceae bacterium]